MTQRPISVSHWLIGWKRWDIFLVTTHFEHEGMGGKKKKKKPLEFIFTELQQRVAAWIYHVSIKTRRHGLHANKLFRNDARKDQFCPTNTYVNAFDILYWQIDWNRVLWSDEIELFSSKHTR
ncbi:hypothetical protein CHARACLAT_013197 [Characodon lateralis]|uniref:Uncharacterized protein n=1 Tax=Characodon lateralis TaxID=208331 RepID=A0ABU7E9C0_9TELE|nr:hypothetical protein [Characodon lateralis]